MFSHNVKRMYIFAFLRVVTYNDKILLAHFVAFPVALRSDVMALYNVFKVLHLMLT